MPVALIFIKATTSLILEAQHIFIDNYQRYVVPFVTVGLIILIPGK
jgi:hypothetical protein